jgi:hypothetical protein
LAASAFVARGAGEQVVELDVEREVVLGTARLLHLVHAAHHGAQLVDLAAGDAPRGEPADQAPSSAARTS